MKTLAFFNNKGGVGKTSLVYHLAWMYAELGVSVVAVDLDPQANLTSVFLEDERLEQIWPDGEHPDSIMGAIAPLLDATGDVCSPHVEELHANIGLIAGDLELARAEDYLSDVWPLCLSGEPRAFRVSSAFYRLMDDAAKQRHAELVLIDVGPNLGAINRAAIIAADYIAVPMAPDLFSLQGLRNLGPTLRRWRSDWQDRLARAPALAFPLPGGEILPVGYIVSQHVVRQDRPTIAYNRWMQRIPGEYRRSILNKPDDTQITVDTDPYRLAQLKHYRSLMPMAMEAHKPMFLLKPADGAIGAHVQAVQNCHSDFQQLAYTLAERCGIEIPVKFGKEQITLF